MQTFATPAPVTAILAVPAILGTRLGNPGTTVHNGASDHRAAP